ncbi:MAG: GNAT family N-acetyltransferase [Gammaproteobacteria bacterium]|nr:MAG: GNAT family N-acetyltransferase [Gammaproteobacteria bacterium]
MKKQLSPYSGFTIKWATLEWEKQQAYALRRMVFCKEQALFEESDLDHVDHFSHLIVALGSYGGWHEEVVGTVRIHETKPGSWAGSRLAVSEPYRCQSLLGPALIKLAVSSAHGLGCRSFFAQVQVQNQRLFERMHWAKIGDIFLRGKEHVTMQANLAHYPPNFLPERGVVVRSRPQRRLDHLRTPLLSMPVSTVQQVA